MKIIAPLAALALVSACHRAPVAPAVSKAWVRLPAVPGAPGAAYFTLKGGRVSTMLVRIESAMVGKIELHESMSGVGKMAGMVKLEQVVVSAHGTVPFAPGGRHAMLFSIDPFVKPGTAIPLRFGFADGTVAEAEAKTVAAGGDAPY